MCTPNTVIHMSRTIGALRLGLYAPDAQVIAVAPVALIYYCNFDGHISFSKLCRHRRNRGPKSGGTKRGPKLEARGRLARTRPHLVSVTCVILVSLYSAILPPFAKGRYARKLSRGTFDSSSLQSSCFLPKSMESINQKIRSPKFREVAV